MSQQTRTTKTNINTKSQPGTNNSKIDISAIVTVNNYGNDIKSLYESLKAVLKQSGKKFEIIFVDDGSVDNTYDEITKIVNSNDGIKLVRMRSTFGEASAFDAGLKQTCGDIIVYFTARVRINPQGIPQLLNKLDQGNDLVVGWRYPRRDSKLNQIISRMFNFIVKRFSKLQLHDMNSGVMVTRREVMEKIHFYGDLNNFTPVLAVRQGYKVAEEKIEQLTGTFRKSRYIQEYMQRLLDIITVIFLTKYSKKPIHFLGFLGLIFTIVGGIIDIYLFIYRILGVGPIAGRPLLLLGALLLVIGIQMISIGLLGEMIIFTHAREIKEYNIEQILE
jgi:glycosyltransferase involved in cell wall biosynthesis